MKGYVNLTHTNNGKINELGDKIDNLTKNAQSDWEQTDESALDYIKNKPIIPEGSVLYPTTGQHTDGAMTQKAVTTELNRLSDNVSQLSNPNLLINGDFRVNQRGQSSYTGNTYSVDRWLGFAGATVSPTTSGIQISGLASYGMISQYIEDYSKFANTTLTLSVKINNISYSTGVIGISIYDGVSATTTVINSGSSGVFTATKTINANPTQLRIRILYNNATNVSDVNATIEYAKLEVGSVATPFSPRPYTEELALCQRYYLKYSPSNSYAMLGTGIVFSSSAIVIGVSLPVTLRTPPTITANGNFYVRTTSATYTTNNNALTLSPSGLFNNVLQIEITSANTIFTNGDCAVLRVSENTAYLSLDAELY